MESPLGGPSHWSASLFYIFVFRDKAGPVGPVGGEGRGHGRSIAGPRRLGGRGPGRWPGLARPSKLGLQRRVIPRAAEAVPTTLETSHCLLVRIAGRSRDEGMWPLPGFLPTPSAQVSAAL